MNLAAANPGSSSAEENGNPARAGCQILVYRAARFAIVLASRRCLVFCSEFCIKRGLLWRIIFSVTKSVFQKSLLSKNCFELLFAC